jgi:hypothetical protein
VRDAGREYHPVIGIASLENAPLRINCRDKYLGWTVESFHEEVANLHDTDDVKTSFERLVRHIDEAMNDVNSEDLCSQQDILNADKGLVDRLNQIASDSVTNLQEARARWLARDNDESAAPMDRSDLGNISLEMEDALYRRKRAESLAQLIAARILLINLLSDSDFASNWQGFLLSEEGGTAIRRALKAIKNRHVGTSILELNVCGSIPPYNALLGGKLVALVMLSPQVVADYRERYGNRASDIASRLKGTPVVRPAELVYVGTTSLYYVGSSQYNRLSLPAGFFQENAPTIRWKKIGQTMGFGTLHISRLTLQCLEETINDGDGNGVSSVFGEGASPKLRKVRKALDHIFEQGQVDVTSQISRHAMPRLVYGVWLATNGTSWLRGEDDDVSYYFGTDSAAPEAATKSISDFWINRWFLPRLQHQEAIDKTKNFRVDDLIVSKDLVPSETSTFVPISAEVSIMPDESTASEESSFELLRKLYRGVSAYADQIDLSFLSAIHIKTRLDDAIVNVVKSRKSVVLTGNVGDGKTHILRVLSKRLKRLVAGPMIELDASTMFDEELYEKWQSCEEQGKPFCVAINQAVLFNLASSYSDFSTLTEATSQVENAIQYSESEEGDSIVRVFDFNRRNILSADVVNAVFDHLTKDSFQEDCRACHFLGSCDFIRNCRLLRDETARARIQILLDRVSRRGYHATLRELLSMASYLLFGGRSCEELARTSGDREYSLPELLFSGEGDLFDALRASLDLSNISHPTWDEILIAGDTQSTDWAADWQSDLSSLDLNNSQDFMSQFSIRKRAFFLFHKNGDDLLAVTEDNETRFAEFLNLDDREALKFLIQSLNLFFCDRSGGDELRIWQSHRYDNSTRKVLYSVDKVPRNRFEIAHPRLAQPMAEAFDFVEDHILLRLKTRPEIYLRVDFEAYELLARARDGIPVMSLGDYSTRRIWQFVERLSLQREREHGDEIEAVIFDPATSEQIKFTVDTNSSQYTSVLREVPS